MVRPIRVLVIDGHEIVVAGLTVLIERDRELHLVGVARSGGRGLDLITALEPEVVLLGNHLPDAGDVELCERIVSIPMVGVVVVSIDASDDVLWHSLHAGARGFVHISIGGEELRQAIKTVAKGEAALDPKVAGRVIDWVRHRTLDPASSLSRRETQVMRLVCRGATDRHIALSLGVSPNTVKTYLRRSLDKLGCRTRSEGAAEVARWGLADPGPEEPLTSEFYRSPRFAATAAAADRD